ncbi:hypothetical protein EMIHUDRAFT_205434 [Emiliania huxleyi CCMP1516]|uniref:Fe2OG dioxygenase domain-containing protein n=2 Tax=Emiliania huxleyi TaxID=2903 RepID=A0A0D3JSC6_EMIH1|nr:hypothetical protein EMIHUDRAFT_205434 [Emiliania huxleyi CCMP1516]EOD26411.1 hypothetical protein EMIHUDRAFT_205434 [Emiliania huxleyi CCMP1516]|eukprot:XP_005778840.1 hypothetical protein EMIHUDRAFT_205434 [Emiliania huxleyi CCMP1516]
MLRLSRLPLRPSPLLLLVSACRGDPSFDCEGWARSGECKSNPMFMEQHCAKACATAAPTLDQHGEMEQCAGWSSQGECTRNPKFMLSSCPKNCAAQRAAVHEAALDESPGCIDEANEATCKKSALAQRCAGSCEGWAICSSEADPEECRKALRCRELTDLDADCAVRVGSRGCAGLELKRCYLSCARSDLAGVLRRYRDRLTVRTRRYGRIDEDVGPLGFAKGRSGEEAYVAALLPGAAGAGNALRLPDGGVEMTEDPVVAAVTARASLLTGYPEEHIEPLQLACDYEENASNGYRHVTMLIYLTDVADEYNGHTTFPKLQLSVSPAASSAVVFNDCLPNGDVDPRTLHGGSPPTNSFTGAKVAINVWIRAAPWKRASERVAAS